MKQGACHKGENNVRLYRQVNPSWKYGKGRPKFMCSEREKKVKLFSEAKYNSTLAAEGKQEVRVEDERASS